VSPEVAEAPPETLPSDEAERTAEEVVAAAVGDAFGWTGFGEMEESPIVAEGAMVGAAVPEIFESSAPEPVAAEQPPIVAEAATVDAVTPESVETFAPEPVAAVLPEKEAPPVLEPLAVEEPPPPEALAVDGLLATEEPSAQPAQQAPPPAEQAPAPPPAPIAATVEQPSAPTQPPPPRAAPSPQAAGVDEPFAAEQAYLKENPRDYDAWLSLARELWQVGDRKEALSAYGRLIRAGKSLETVTTELEEYVEQWPDVATRRVLGDAYMKGGKLDRALELYREALETL
jgi:hypothetical protein